MDYWHYSQVPITVLAVLRMQARQKSQAAPALTWKQRDALPACAALRSHIKEHVEKYALLPKDTHIFIKVMTNGRLCVQLLCTGANCEIKRNEFV